MLSNFFFRLVYFLIFAIICMVSLPFSGTSAEPPQTRADIQRISIKELLEWQEQEPVVIVDARITRAWKRAGNKIPGAIRLDRPAKVAHFTNTTDPQQAVLVYCL